MRNLLVVCTLLTVVGGGAALAAGPTPAPAPAKAPAAKVTVTYDSLSAEARDLPADQLESLEWRGDTCDKITNDLFKRQCRLLAPGVGQKGSVYRVKGDADALWLGQFDAKAKAVPFEVFGCVTCGKAKGEGSFVVAVPGVKNPALVKNPARIEGETLRGPSLGKDKLAFADEAAARTWRDASAGRLRVELLVAAPSAPNGTTAGERKGFYVQLVGYRVWDACDGKVLAAAPAADKGPIDEAACGKKVVEKPVDPDAGKPKLPAQLSVSAVKTAMGPTEDQIMEACYGQYGVTGRADLNITIAGDGTVKKVAIKGKFKDTPTGDCVVQKVQAVKFPPFSDPSMTIGYPIILR